MSITNYYLTSSNEENINNTRIKVLSDKEINDDQIKRYIQEIYLKNPKVSIYSIVLTLEKSIKYRVNEETSDHDLNPSSDLKGIDLKIKNVSVKSLQSIAPSKSFRERAMTVKEIYEGLYAPYKTDAAPIRFLFTILLAPVALFNRLLSPKTRDFISQSALIPKAHGKDELVKLLQAHQEIFSQSEETHSKMLYEQMDEALSLLSHSNEKDSRAVAIKIQMRFEEAKQEKGKVNLALIPSGYWQNGVYFPSLMAIYKNEENKICLSEMTYGEKEGIYAREFVWEKTPEKLDKLIFQLVKLNEKPPYETKAKGITWKETEGTLYLGALVYLTQENIDIMPEINPASINPLNILPIYPQSTPEWREGLIAMTGGVPAKNIPAKREQIRDDPWKILHELIRHQFPDVAWADKITFAVGVLNYKLEKIISDWEGLSINEQKRWVEELQREFQHLESAVGKLTRSEDMINFEPFKKIKSTIEILNWMVPKHRHREDEIKERLTHLSESTSNFSLSIKVPEQKTMGSEKSTPPPLDIGIADLQKVQNLRDFFEHPTLDQLPSMLETLTHVSTKLDGLVGRKKFDEAKHLYRMVARIIPTVGKGEFWTLLASAEDSQIERVSRLFTDMTTYFWEAKLKTWEVPLAHFDLIQMHNIELCLNQMLIMRSDRVLAKLNPYEQYGEQYVNLGQISLIRGGRFPFPSSDVAVALKKAGLTFNEIALLGPLTWMPWDNTYASSALNSFAHRDFRPGIDPELDLRIEGMKSYLLTIKSHIKPKQEYYLESKSNGIIINTNWSPENNWDRLNDEMKSLYKGFYGKEMDDLEFGTGCVKYGGRFPYADQFVDKSRLELIRVSMEKEETALQFVPGFKNLLERVKLEDELYKLPSVFAMVKRYWFLTKETEAEKKERLDELKAHLQKMGRFEITSSIHPINGKPHSLIGITERGMKEPLILLDRSGVHPYFRLRIGQGYFHELPADKKLFADEAGVLQKKEESSLEHVVHQVIEVINDSNNTFQESENKMLGEAQKFSVSDDNKQRWGYYKIWNLICLEVGKDHSAKESYSRVNVMETLEYILKYPAYLDDPIVRNRLITVLGKTGVIQDLLDNNPDYLFRLGPLLTEEIENALKNGFFSRAGFIMQIGSLIVNRIPSMLPQNEDSKKGALLDALQAFPSIDKLYGDNPKPGYEILIAYVERGDISAKDKMDIFTAILSHFATHPDSLKIIAQNPTLGGKLLTIASKLKVNASNTTTPLMANLSLGWFSHVLAPALITMDPSTSSVILNGWLMTQEGVDNLSGWKLKEGSDRIFISGNHEIDIVSLKITLAAGKEATGEKALLPPFILQNRDYIKLFGLKAFTADQKRGGSEEESIYLFSDDEGVKYRLTFNITENKITFEREILHNGKQEWFRWENRLEMKGKGIEIPIAKKGVWISLENPQKGISFLDNKRYSLKFGKAGELKAIHTNEGLKVSSDGEGALRRVLSPINEGDTVFISYQDSNFIQEIRLLGQGITLKRNGEKLPWIVSEGIYKGYEWKMEGQGISPISTLLGFMGESVEQFGLVLKHPETGDAKILIWPKEITSAHPDKIPIEFKDTEVTHPIIMTLGKDGKVKGSSGAYLYLSYLAIAKHEYALAEKYLNQAAKMRLSPLEPLILNEIKQALLNLPGLSKKNIALKLKAILQANFILRQQNGIVPGAQLENNVKIGRLIDKYEELSLKSPLEKSLTEEEIIELKALGSEGLSHLSAPFDPSRLTSTDLVLKTESPAATSVKNGEAALYLVPLVVMEMVKPPKDLKSLLPHLEPMKPEFLIQNYFSIWNLTLQEGLIPADFISLFNKLPSTGDPKKDAVADLCRSTLLALAKDNEEGKKGEPFDLKALYSLHDSIPGSIVGKLFSVLIAKILPSLSKEKGALLVAIGKKFINFITQHVETITITPLTDRKMALKEGKRGLAILTVRELKEKIVADPDLFGIYTPLLAELLPEKEPEELIDPLETIKSIAESYNSLMNKKDKARILHYNMELDIHEQELSKRIHLLEETLRKESSPKDIKDNTLPFLHVEKTPFSEKVQSFQIDVRDQEVVQNKLKEGASKLKNVLSKADDPLDAADELELIQGIEEAELELQALYKTRLKVFDRSKLEILKMAIFERKEIAQNLAHERKNKILNLCKTENKASLPFDIRRELPLLSDEELFERVLNGYQKFELPIPQLETLIQEFLIFQTEAQQLGDPATEKLEELFRISKEEQFDESSYNLISFKLSTLLNRATDRHRYFDNEGRLLDPLYHRKILVTEYRTGHILRNEQIDLIKHMVEDPNKIYKFKMGFGKTSYILPIVLMVLAEKGICAVGVLKDELLLKGYAELDEGTRLMIDQAALLYKFELSSNIPSSILAQQYYRLLESKKYKGYVVTSLHTQASIEQKLVLISIERESLMKKIMQISLSDPLPPRNDPRYEILHSKIKAGFDKGDKQIIDLISNQKQGYWLQKTRDLLYGNKDYFGFETQRILDEADDSLSIQKEDNLALGTAEALKIPVERPVRLMCEILMKVVYTSKDPSVTILRQAILTGSQSALRPQFVRDSLMPALTNAVLEDDEFFGEIGCSNPDSATAKAFKNMDRGELIKFISNRDSDWPKGIDKRYDKEALPGSDKDRFQKGMGVLKTLIQNSLPKGLALNPDLDVGVKESEDGVTIGPRVRGAEQKGMVYSEEFDIIANHYIQYAIKIPETSFFKTALAEFRESDPTKFIELMHRFTEAQKKDSSLVTILDFINLPENFHDRLNLFNTSVVEKELLARYARQVVIPVQELAKGNVKGMTGTLDDYSMPGLREDLQMEKPVSRAIEGEFLLRIATGKREPRVKTIEKESEILPAIAPKIQDPECKFIIAEGSTLGGLNSLEAIKKLKGIKGCDELVYVFTYPEVQGDPRSRKNVVWKKGADEPELVTRKEITALQRDKESKNKVRFYYGPVDSRGTDYGPIEPGFALFIPGPTTTNDSRDQAVARARGIGDEHWIEEIIILNSQADRIRNEQNIDNIGWENVVNDIRLQTLQEDKGKHLKAAMGKITSGLTMAARDIINWQDKARDSIFYWSKNNLSKMGEDLIEDAFIFKIFENLLIQTRAVNYQALYAPSKEVGVEIKMNQLFNEQLKLVDQRLERVDEELKPGVKKRKTGDKLLALKKELLKRQDLFNKDIEEHKKKIPAKVSTNNAEVAVSMGTVNVTQAESVIVQQQGLEKGVSTEHQIEEAAPFKLDIDIRSEPYQKFDLKNIEMLSDNFGLSFTDESSLEAYCFKGLKFTPDFLNIYKYLPGSRLPGEPFGLIGILGDNVFVLSRADYAWIMKKELEENRKGDQKEPLAVIGLINATQYKAGSRGFIVRDLGKNSPDWDDRDLKRKIIQVKWLMGISQYSEEERSTLKEWFIELFRGNKSDYNLWAMNKYINDRSTSSQKKVYEELLKSMKN